MDENEYMNQVSELNNNMSSYDTKNTQYRLMKEKLEESLYELRRARAELEVSFYNFDKNFSGDKAKEAKSELEKKINQLDAMINMLSTKIIPEAEAKMAALNVSMLKTEEDLNAVKREYSDNQITE